jgi:hypothetical protein
MSKYLLAAAKIPPEILDRVLAPLAREVLFEAPQRGADDVAVMQA